MPCRRTRWPSPAIPTPPPATPFPGGPSWRAQPLPRRDSPSCRGTCSAARARRPRATSSTSRASASAEWARTNLDNVRGREHRRPVRRRLRPGGPGLQEVPERQAVQGLPRHAGRAEGHRRGHRRDARSHPRRDRHGRHGAEEARLRAEAADPFRPRGPAADGDRPQVRSGDPDGQPGAFGRGHPPSVRMGVGRRHRPHPRGARLDQPAGVAFGHRSGPAHGDSRGSSRPRLGPVARPGPLPAPITPPITPPSGARGGISGPARWATWRATSSIRSSGR